MKGKKYLKLAFLFAMLLLFSFSTHVFADDNVETQKIGVVVLSPERQEMQMFMTYYRDYIEEGFPVEFYFSETLADWEEEEAYLTQLKEAGVNGVISFYTYDVEKAVEFCASNEMYYIMASSTITDEQYEALKENPWFLGTIGPDAEKTYQSGREMAEYFLEKGGKSFVIMSGGACRGTLLHKLRTVGMLEVLAENAGVVLGAEAEEVAVSEEIVKLSNEDGSVSVVICPDYTENGSGLDNLSTVFADGDYDVLMSAFHTNTYIDVISEKEKSQGSNIMVGAIDSFTEENFETFQQEDAFGNTLIDYIEGKYASMAGPAFAILYNAVTGYPEVCSEDGNAFRLYMGFWTAKSSEEYVELYGYTTGIFENAYSCLDLMRVMKAYNSEATWEDIKALTEAYSVDDVKHRIMGW